MKIIHTADWHIGNTFHGYDRSDEHRNFLDFLLTTISSQEADALIVAGDVFDNPNPSAEAQKIYYDFLNRATTANPGLQIVVIAGNHDSAARLEASSSILQRQKIYVRGSVPTDDKGGKNTESLIIPLCSRNDADDTVICLAVPFLRMADLPQADTFSKSMGKFFRDLTSDARKLYGKKSRLLLAAHFYATGSEIAEEEHSERVIVGGEENVDASKFCDEFSYAALGHIHKAQHVAHLDHARYSGSPLPMSFSERGYHHGVNVVDFAADGMVTLNVVEYEPLRKLLSIPRTGTATVQQAVEAVCSLPKADKKDPGTDWPYVEVRLGTTNDTTANHQIKESFAGRAAHFCTIRNNADKQTASTSLDQQTEKELSRLNPLALAKKVYENNYNGSAMPQELVDKFNTACKIASESEEEQ